MEQAAPRVSLRHREFTKLCSRKGWTTQAQQARAFGHSEAYISRLVRAKTDPTAAFIAVALETLECRFEEVFEVTADEAPLRRAS
jgi:predicted transcriptional regulator